MNNNVNHVPRGSVCERPSSKPKQEIKKSFWARFGTMNLILVIIGITLLCFTITMIRLFKTYGAIPDTLVTCVFAVLGGECGVMGWIKTSKERNRDRAVELQDRKYYEQKENSASNGMTSERSFHNQHNYHENGGY